MDFEQAIQNIQKEYNTWYNHKDSISIETNQMLTEYNFCFVSLINYHGRLILTDLTNNMEHITLDENEVKEICKKYNIVFNDYNLECEYTSNEDIKRYLQCLNEISEKMNTK